MWTDLTRGSRVLKELKEIACDDCIDLYCAGILKPAAKHVVKMGYQSKMQTYQEEVIRWFGWISVFRNLVHDVDQTVGTKIGDLRSNVALHIVEECIGNASTKDSYMRALIMLKRKYGDRILRPSLGTWSPWDRQI